MLRERTDADAAVSPSNLVDVAIQQGKRRFAWLVVRDTFMVAAIVTVLASLGLGMWMSQEAVQLETQMVKRSIGGRS